MAQKEVHFAETVQNGCHQGTGRAVEREAHGGLELGKEDLLQTATVCLQRRGGWRDSECFHDKAVVNIGEKDTGDLITQCIHISKYRMVLHCYAQFLYVYPFVFKQNILFNKCVFTVLFCI